MKPHARWRRIPDGPRTFLRSLVLAVVFAGAAGHAQVPSVDALTVTVEGFAAVGADEGLARDQAIRDALRNAVEQAVGTSVGSRTLMVDYAVVQDHVTARTDGFIRSYRVTQEGRDGTAYRVTIEAIVDTRLITEDLQNFGAMLRATLGNPRIHLTTPDAATRDAHRLLTDALVARGFLIITPTHPQDADITATITAHHEIVQERPLANGTLYSVRTSLTLDAAQSSTSQTLVSVHGDATHPSITIAQATEEATERALATALPAFLQQLTQALNTVTNPETNTITTI